jgi:hypothetical protein
MHAHGAEIENDTHSVLAAHADNSTPTNGNLARTNN